MIDEGALYELSEGWVWAITSEVCSSVRDGTHDTPKYVEAGVPLITSKNLKENVIDFSTSKNISIDDHEKISRRSGVENGDVLFAMIGTIGNPVVVQTERIFSIKNVALFKKNESTIISQYLKLWLASSAFNTILVKNEFLKGTTQKFIPLGNLRILPIPLPPIFEQQAIVSKIEQLFSDLDNGIDNFKKAQEQLKIYRQAVLKNACEGKLVPTEAELAHAEGCDYEPADVLLARILEERRKKWNGKGKYKEPAAADTSELSELPEGWIFGRLENIAEINPKLPYNDYSDNMEVSFLPMRVVEEQTGIFDLSINKKYIEVKKGYTSFIDGDIIFAKITPCMENGKIAIVDKLKNGIGFGSTEFHVIRLYGDQFIKKYLFFYLVQKTFRNGAQRNMTGSAGQLRVPTNYIRQTLLPFPPLAEQRRIVVEVGRRLSICDKLEATIAESLQKAEALRQSILKKAFEGKLLNEKELEEARSSPDWEPAEKLLERIRQEKQIKENNNKSTRRKTHG